METGRLKRWNDDKGFGFISAPDREGDVFVSISALKRTGSGRRSRAGDTRSCELQRDSTDKRRAVNARIEGVAATAPTSRRARPSHACFLPPNRPPLWPQVP